MVQFILNNQLVRSDKPSGMSLLDFIRYEMDLPGTKCGCREGDCGACTVLQGTLCDGKMSYMSIVSCLTPIVNVNNKHIVTIEGINDEILSPLQEVFLNNSSSQCGFCTPGFVMSLTSHALATEKSTKEAAVESLSGNICRCTGYKSIQKAAEEISCLLKNKDVSDPVRWLVEKEFLPEYFLTIPAQLSKIDQNAHLRSSGGTTVAGGTDLMVQNPDRLAEAEILSFITKNELKGINIENGSCFIGASVTVNELKHSDLLNDILPGFFSFFRFISSEPVRNMATVAGNIVNASPIGDLSIIFLALNSDITVSEKNIERIVPLKDFFLGYKKLDLRKNEYVRNISFRIPSKPVLFNFEKVSKRTHLDIASVNSAICIKITENKISECFLSAGGVSPIPLFLSKTSEFLIGKNPDAPTVLNAVEIIKGEISPISDIRGSGEYKTLLLRQLFFSHFIELFPDRVSAKDILDKI